MSKLSDTITLQGPLCGNCKSNHMQAVVVRQDGYVESHLWHCVCGHCATIGNDLDDAYIDYDGEDVQYV